MENSRMGLMKLFAYLLLLAFALGSLYSWFSIILFVIVFMFIVKQTDGAETMILIALAFVFFSVSIWKTIAVQGDGLLTMFQNPVLIAVIGFLVVLFLCLRYLEGNWLALIFLPIFWLVFFFGMMQWTGLGSRNYHRQIPSKNRTYEKPEKKQKEKKWKEKKKKEGIFY